MKLRACNAWKEASTATSLFRRVWIIQVFLLLFVVDGTPGDIEEFKIMGERNTGTRYLQQLLQKNLPIPHLRLAVDGTKLNAMSETQKVTLRHDVRLRKDTTKMINVFF